MLKKVSILAVVLLAFSCKKNESPVGVDVLPTSDQLGGAYAEIIPSVSYTRADDSIMTTNISNSNLLGSVNDPVFGRFDASVYINFEPLGNISCSSLGTNPVLDSAVLKLNYNTSAYIPFIGDTTDPLSIDVFPLTRKLDRDSFYYSSRNIPYNASYSMIEGGSKSFTPLLKTSRPISKDDPALYPPQLRIRLKKEVGEQLFNCAYLSSSGALQNTLYGLFITTNRSVLPQPSYGSVFYINSLDSRLYLYYHYDGANGPVLPLEILCGANSTRFGRFEHDYQFLAEQSLAQQLKPNYDTLPYGKQHLYVQGAGGLRAQIELADLKNWRDSNIVINKAQLCFTVDNSKPEYNDPSKYPLPIRLYLEVQDPSTGKPISLYENVYAFGGTYDPFANHYAFNIPHTVAQTMTGKKDFTKFYVSMYQTGLFPQRVVLGGWGSTNAPVKLKLWYTRLQFPKK